MLRRASNEKGLTLVEIMLVIAVVSIAVVLLTSLMGNMDNEKKEMNQAYQERNNYEIMMKELVHELKFAKNVSVQNADDVEVLRYEVAGGEKRAVIFKNGKMYEEINEKEYEIAEVDKIEGEMHKVSYEDGIVEFNVELINLQAKMNFKVVLRNE